ncbi:MAG: HAD-IA family hydrolase, partial [Niameybacter sp.]
MTKKAILFDSGKVLNYPTTGHWFIIPSFFEYVDRAKWNTLSATELQVAFSEAYAYLNAQTTIMNREEEYGCFLEYYKILFKHLKALEVSEEQIERLTYDYVYTANKYTFFEDAKTVIPKLHEHYQLAIVSDAWPSLEQVYIEVDLRKYFAACIISSQLGVVKPHPSMYETALEALGIKPEEALFIDDSIGNCEGAIQLGIDAVLLCRDPNAYLEYKKLNTLHVIAGLDELEEILMKDFA